MEIMAEAWSLNLKLKSYYVLHFCGDCKMTKAISVLGRERGRNGNTMVASLLMLQ